MDHLSDPLMRWVDFRLRYVEPIPRKVYFSDKFPWNLPEDADQGLQKLIADFQMGKDVNPYQGKGLKFHHDTSSTKKQDRTDLLWAEWGIHHFHLTGESLLSENYFSKRSDWLLFCVIGEGINKGGLVCFIDVLPHNQENLFSDTSLIQTIADNWPTILEKFEMKGMMPGTSFTDAEIGSLRKSGVTTPLNINGKVYMPLGLGISTAATSNRVMAVMSHIRHGLGQLAKFACNSEFKQAFGFQEGDAPNFRLDITPRGLAIYEEQGRGIYVLPRRGKELEYDPLTQLHDYLLPT